MADLKAIIQKVKEQNIQKSKNEEKKPEESKIVPNIEEKQEEQQKSPIELLKDDGIFRNELLVLLNNMLIQQNNQVIQTENLNKTLGELGEALALILSK